jgi:hypothetical protein
MKESKIVWLEFSPFYPGLQIVDAGRQDARLHTKLEKELMANWKQSRENRILYTPESGESVAEVTKEIKTMGRRRPSVKKKTTNRSMQSTKQAQTRFH